MLANVKSSATIDRQPEVPNLIAVIARLPLHWIHQPQSQSCLTQSNAGKLRELCWTLEDCENRDIAYMLQIDGAPDFVEIGRDKQFDLVLA